MKDYLPYFKAPELRCHCGKCNGGEMDNVFMDNLILIRESCGFPFIISSAYRCAEHNAKVGGEPDSMHLFGRAVDIATSNPNALIIVKFALQFGMDGIGVSQKNSKPRMIHLDNRTKNKAIWSY